MAPQCIAYLMLLQLLSGKYCLLLPFLFAEMQEMLAPKSSAPLKYNLELELTPK